MESEVKVGEPDDAEPISAAVAYLVGEWSRSLNVEDSVA